MKQKGFTLVELMVVISIIGLMSSIVLVSFNRSRMKARDARRLEDMHTIQTALEMYYDKYGYYPDNTDLLEAGCESWDVGATALTGDTFIEPLKTGSIMTNVPIDPTGVAPCGGYAYFRYYLGSGAWTYPERFGCNANSDFYVLGVKDMEMSNGPHPSSPGFKCPGNSMYPPGRDWQNELEWVTGGIGKGGL
jgi:prepilin-type N-terminal cleavage/methylation domain-containing protein